MIDHIWEGVYQSFAEVPVTGEGFSGTTWNNNSLKRISKLLDTAKSSATIPAVVAYNASLLPLITALIGEASSEATVLDFGGGLGFTYFASVAGLAKKISLNYYIVDSEMTCEVGKQVFADDDRIHFRHSLPEDMEKVDIVHLGSSLQYVENWKSLLNDLTRYQPRYFLFTDLVAGEIPTYATAQNYYGSKIACWFFNVNEIIDEMLSLGFRLVFKSTFVNTYLGKEQKCPQENFPEELRLEHTCALLFVN